MALAMNVRTNVGSALAAPVVAGVPSFKQTSSVRFTNGAVVFKRASLVVVRAEKETVEPGPAGRSGNTSSPPTTPAGMSGSEAPMGVISKSAPLDQGSEVPVAERMAYVCQDCGYVYDQETPFEDVPEEYNCPQCSAPKSRFIVANASVGDMLDTTKEEDAVSRGSGVKSGSPPSEN
jgi:rubredoxin